MKCDKFSFTKSRGFVHEWNGYGEIFSRPQVMENSIGNICFSEQIFHRKQSLGAPDLGFEFGTEWLKYIREHLLWLTLYIKNTNKHVSLFLLTYFLIFLLYLSSLLTNKWKVENLTKFNFLKSNKTENRWPVRTYS